MACWCSKILFRRDLGSRTNFDGEIVLIIAGGVPAKIIRYRFSEDVIEKLEEIKWWNLPEAVLKEKISLFQKEGLTVEELDVLKENI